MDPPLRPHLTLKQQQRTLQRLQCLPFWSTGDQCWVVEQGHSSFSSHDKQGRSQKTCHSYLMNVFLRWLVLLVFLLFVYRSASFHSREFRHVHRNVCVRRSENNLGCWYSPFTLGQISFSPLDCLFQATWPGSVGIFSCLLPSCHGTTEVTDIMTQIFMWVPRIQIHVLLSLWRAFY